MTKTKSLCHGCRNNFYNGNNPMGIKECFSYANGEVVKRFRIGWWTNPNSKSDFEHVTTLSCHSAPGEYAQYESLPAHLTREPTHG